MRIVAPQVFGVSVADIRGLGKTLGTRHDLAEPLWKTGWYEARMLVAFVADPARLTPAQMDRWTRDFDNWAICDHLTFHLFDRSPHAWRKVDQWAAKDAEFVKRAAFALLAALALHDKDAGDRDVPRPPAARRDARRPIGATSSRRASAGRCAASAAATSSCTPRPWRSRDVWQRRRMRRRAGSARTRCAISPVR